MRLWSPHPSILDRAALVSCWRESLLAQKVLEGGTTGYRHHPQLLRFRAHADPRAAIGVYLTALQSEATARGYRFDAAKILRPGTVADADPIPVTRGQLAHELEHLRRKVTARDPNWLPRLPAHGDVPAHPLLRVVDGDVESWEVI